MTSQLGSMLKASPLSGHKLPCKAIIPTSRRTIETRAVASQDMSRRASLGMLAAGPAMLMANKALALIPANDDEDEELVEKAKSKRTSQIGKERKAEQKFASSEGYTDNTIKTIQRAVKKMAKGGSEISEGNLKQAASTVSASWVAEFRKAADTVSTSAQTKDAAQQVFLSLSTVGQAAKAGDASTAKKSFVGLVSALQTWTTEAGISGRLSGI